MAGTDALRSLMVPFQFFGIPVVYDRFVPKGGTMYLLDSNCIVIGTYVRLPSVASIITSQRKRRGK